MPVSELIEKIQRFAVQQECGCWRWIGAKQAAGNTPAMSWQGQVGNVRRFILVDQGIKMKGYLAGVSCGNLDCVNPEHVVRATRSKMSTQSAANMDAAKKTMRSMRIALAARSRAKLSPEIAEAIRNDGRPQRAIAAEYGVTQHTVGSIKSGQMWRDYQPNPFAGLIR